MFAFYKLAVILEGINARFLMGKTVGEGFDQMGGMVTALLDSAFGVANASKIRGAPRLSARVDTRALPLIALGGAIGALGRYGLGRAFPVGAGTFPTTTLCINVAGAFLLAVLLETLVRRGTPDHWLRLLVGIGVLGAFTTFSTFATSSRSSGATATSSSRWSTRVASVVAGGGRRAARAALAGWRRAPVPDEGES